jgi:hypothetical protein
VSQVLKPLLKDNAYMYLTKRPLPEEEEGVLRVLSSNLEWSDLVWGEQSLSIKGLECIAPLRSYKFFSVNA